MRSFQSIYLTSCTLHCLSRITYSTIFLNLAISLCLSFCTVLYPPAWEKLARKELGGEIGPKELEWITPEGIKLKPLYTGRDNYPLWIFHLVTCPVLFILRKVFTLWLLNDIICIHLSTSIILLNDLNKLDNIPSSIHSSSSGSILVLLIW